jgi:hypothetical protein
MRSRRGKAGPRRTFITVRQGFEGAFTGESSKQEVLARLSEFSLDTQLGFLSRISGLLLFRAPDDPEFTNAVVHGLFGHKAERLMNRVTKLRDAYAQEGSDSSVAVFEHAQLLVAAKLCLANVHPATVDGPSPVRFGEALLMIGDIVSREMPLPKSIDTSDPEVVQVWIHYLVLTGLFFAHENRIHLLTRYYDLYTADHSPGEALKLGVIFKAATGLSPEEYWAVAFALLAHWSTFDLNTAAAAPAFVSREHYFSENFEFSQAETNVFFGLFSRPADELRIELAKCGDAELWGGYYPLPLAMFPLVGVGDKLYCPSVRLLLERMTDGLYHTLLNAVDSDQRNRFQVYTGELFERYVNRLLVRIFSSARTMDQARFVNEDTLKAALGGADSAGFSDGLIIRGETVIVIECKATRLSLARRSGMDIPGTIGKLHEMFVDGIGQTYKTIEAIKSGRLSHIGIKPERYKRYIPLLVTLEHIPLRGVLYRAMDVEIQRATPRHYSEIQPWQTFHIGELEAAEGAMASGHSIIDFLERKVSNRDFCHEGATNYCFAVGDTFLTAYRSPYLEEKFRALSATTTNFFRSRAKRPS